MHTFHSRFDDFNLTIENICTFIKQSSEEEKLQISKYINQQVKHIEAKRTYDQLYDYGIGTT